MRGRGRHYRVSRWSAQARLGCYTLAALIWRADERCAWCALQVERTAYAIDHVVPRVLGGTDAPSNLVLSCMTCNCTRGGHGGVPPALLERIEAMGRTEAECWAEVERQIGIPVGRGTDANRAARALAAEWFGAAIEKDLRFARNYKARVAEELKEVPF